MHGGHLKLWIFGSIILLVVISVLVTTHQLAQVTLSEIRLTKLSMGQTFNSGLIGEADRWDRGLTRLGQGARNDGDRVVLGHRAFPAPGRLADHLESTAERRGAVLSWGAAYRLALLLYWIWPGLIVMAAAMVDATARRRIAATSAETPRILRFDLYRHALIGCAGALFAYLLLPIPWISPLVPPVTLLGLIIFAYGTLYNLPARPN